MEVRSLRPCEFVTVWRRRTASPNSYQNSYQTLSLPRGGRRFLPPRGLHGHRLPACRSATRSWSSPACLPFCCPQLDIAGLPHCVSYQRWGALLGSFWHKVGCREYSPVVSARSMWTGFHCVWPPRERFALRKNGETILLVYYFIWGLFHFKTSTVYFDFIDFSFLLIKSEFIHWTQVCQVIHFKCIYT